ncbi:hypothetical protein Tco_1562927 [Tanacetum coccineum]
MIHRQSSQVIHQQASQASAISLQSLADHIQSDSGLVAPYFLPTDDPLECLNKALTFMSTILALSFPSSNTQLETLSDQVYQDAMKERQTLNCVDNSLKSNDDMARKYTHSNTVQHAECFKQKMLLVQLQKAGFNALAEVPNLDNVDNNMINHDVQVKSSSKQSSVTAIQNSNLSAQQDALILSVIEQLKSQVINCTKINLDNKSVNDSLTIELQSLSRLIVLNKFLSEHVKEKESLMQTVTLLKNDFKKEESRNIDREIALEKKIKHPG